MIVIGVLVVGWLFYLYIDWCSNQENSFFTPVLKAATRTDKRIDSLMIILKRIENKLDER